MYVCVKKRCTPYIIFKNRIKRKSRLMCFRRLRLRAAAIRYIIFFDRQNTVLYKSIQSVAIKIFSSKSRHRPPLA